MPRTTHPCRSLLRRSGVIIQSLAPTVELLRVRKSYGGFTAVDDLSFEIPPAHIFGLLGPNGAGKTSTMLVATIGAAMFISGRIYRTGILMYGKRPTIRELSRWLRHA